MAVDMDKHFPRMAKDHRNRWTEEEKERMLEKMKNMLYDGQLVKVIASEVGLEISHAMRFFKRRTGMTMREFRTEHHAAIK